MMKVYATIIALAVAAAPVVPAQAAPQKEGRDALVAAAVEKYGLGDYDGAIEKFEAAYRAEHRSVDLFNIARVYEEAGQPDKARDFYQRFLAKDDLSDDERAAAEQRVRVLSPEPAQPEAAPAPPPTLRPPGTNVATDAAPPSKPPRNRRALIAGGVLLPLGVGQVVAAGVLTPLAVRNAKNADASAAPGLAADKTPHYALAKREALAADILFITGGVTAGVGLITLLAGLDRKHRRKTSRVSLAPAGAGGALHLQF